MKIFRKKSRSRGGFSLVEVLLALAVLGIAMLSVMGLLNASFESVARNVMMRRAIGVYSAFDRACTAVSTMLKPSGSAYVTDEQLQTKSSFEYVYEWVRSKTGSNWNDAAFFVCISRRIAPEDDASPQHVLQIIKCEGASSTPSQAELTELDSEGSAYFMRVYLSPQLEGRYVEMDADGQVLETQYASGGSLPSSADKYALPYLPLTIDIYPFTPGSASVEDQVPVLTQLLVVPR